MPQRDEAAASIHSDAHSSRKLLIGKLHAAMRAAGVAAAASDVRVRGESGNMMPVVSIE